jgi:chromosome partitioning protein
VTARIISVVNQKGGSGKSTVTMVLAGSLGWRGLKVLVVDADAQGTASRWAAAAPDERPFPANVISLAAAGGKVHRELKGHLANYDRILIDCPPSLESPVPASVLLVSDLAIVPVPLAPADLWATRGLKTAIESAQITNERLRAYVLPNRVQRTAINAQVREVLADLGIPVMKARLGLRVAYQEACVGGSTIAALGAPAKTANDEVEALADETEQLLAMEPVT